MAGLIDFLHTLTDCRMSELTPLSIRGEPLGALTPVWRERVLALPYFHAVDDGVALGEAFQGYNDISAVLMRVARQWRDSGVLTGWRDENFTAHDLDGRPCFELERAAFRAFGLQSRAVHINGLVRNADGSWCMWVARRSPLKSVEPDKLDNLTGGDRQRPVVISGDKTVAYEKVMEVMRELQQRGYARIGLLVKTES